MKTSMLLNGKGSKTRRYFVSSFPKKLIDEGFEKEILQSYNCKINTESMQKHNSDDLVSFKLFVPEESYLDFVIWFRKQVDLDLIESY